MNRGDQPAFGAEITVTGDEMTVTHARATMNCQKCLNVSERTMIYCGPMQRISTGIDPWGAVLTDSQIDLLEEEKQQNFCDGIPNEHFHLACPVCHYLWIEDLEDAHLTN